MMSSLVAVLISLLVFAVQENVGREDSWLVDTAQGPVRGYRDPDGDMFVFYNIPYVTTPTGPNKFKAPLPPPTWTQPFEAVDKGVVCPQNWLGLMLGPNSTAQEDCLIANVYVPDTEERNLPVVVIAHGGGFHIAFGNWLRPKNLIRTKKMIVVNFNYRLSIHGFLCLGTDDVPGNAGMKDQVALLRWVKNNIASFGGNPDDVTISGYSAGSASVDLLMLSQSAKGLFKRVIPESGSHLSPFAIQPDPLENAKKVANLYNFTDVDNIDALENFYKTAPFELLSSNIFMDQKDSHFIFSPCVEQDLGQEMFLDDAPINILNSGTYEKVPTLHGFASMEGFMRVEHFENWKTAMNDKFSDFLPADLHFVSEQQKEDVARTVKEFYFGDQPVNNNNILTYIDYFTDVLFAYPTLRSINLQVESGHNQIYLYEYSFVDEAFPLIPYTNLRAADHCAQTIAVLDGITMDNLDESNVTEEYRQMKLTMRELWSNFMTVGQPVPASSSFPAWPPVTGYGSPHMSLDQTVELRGSLLERRARFWDDIYSRHYRVPVPPPATDSASSLQNIWLINLLLICYTIVCK